MPAPTIVSGRMGESPTRNLLTVTQANLRQAWVFARVGDTLNAPMSEDVEWRVSATALMRSPADFGATVDQRFTLRTPEDAEARPEVLSIRGLRSQRVIACVAYLPPVPDVAIVEFTFSCDNEEARLEVWAFADTTAHPYCGLFPCPFGG